MTNATAPDCPKCGRKMFRSGYAQSGKPRWQCRRGTDKDRQYCYMTTNPHTTARPASRYAKPQPEPKFSRALPKGAKRFIITAAQNATPVHAGFWAALQQAATDMQAEILVIPIRYRNPTSQWSQLQENEEWWSPNVTPFLWNQRRKLNDNLSVLGDLKIQPTASSPLTGFEAITRGESGIMGHTKLQLRVVPSPSNMLPKILTTTGAVTVSNYTDSKAGKLGEFHHTLGATLVEVADRKTFHLRQLIADSDGSFTDLDKHYTPNGVQPAPPVEALIMGDTHVDYVCPKVETATFGSGGIVQTLRPRVLVWHDLLDAYAVNPHHNGNIFNSYAKRWAGADDVQKEVQRAIAFVKSRTGSAASVIVSSNHDDFLKRWVITTDWRTDPTNAEFYLRTALAMLQSTRLAESGTTYISPFNYWVEQEGDPRIRALRGESFKVKNIELSLHGHEGPNGARGSIRNLRRIGLRSIIGHSHTPGIDEGCVQVGTSTRLKLEYNHGPSSWLNAHCVIHANGKRQLIFIINGMWKL